MDGGLRVMNGGRRTPFSPLSRRRFRASGRATMSGNTGTRRYVAGLSQLPDHRRKGKSA